MSETLPDDAAHSLDWLHTESITTRVTEWLAGMPDRQREILCRRYGLGGFDPQTLECIAQRVGVTRERVRQIQLAGLAVLRERLTEQGYTPENVLE